MPINVFTRRAQRRTTRVPITTMEEIPVLTDSERAELFSSLTEAETQIAAGEYIEHDPAAFRAHMLNIYRRTKTQVR